MATLAKLTRPRLHRVVARDRLFGRLDACLEAPLVWVSGPPGAGKTSLAASYMETRRLGGWWYQIDAGDADLGTFFHYLSLAATSGRRRTPMPVLAPQHLGDLHGFARLYFRALFERLKAPAVLVLDNYHELPPDSVVHGLLDTIVREAPAGVSLLVVSRTPPPAECAALRAQGMVAELEWDELRLTLEETRRIVETRSAVSEDVLQAVHQRSDGWPVGLVLVLEESRRPQGDAGAGGHGGKEILFDYFAGQIFATLPPATRRILMLVALRPRATAAQAERLTGSAEAASVLDGIYRRRLFVDRRGDAYQFHDLFRAFLAQQFDTTFDAAEARHWRGTAARQMAQDGEVEGAFMLACQAQAWPLAVEIVLTHAATLFEQGRSRTLLAWIDQVPPPVVDAAPWLVFWAAVALAARSPAQSRARFEEAYARFLTTGDTTALTMSCGGVLATSYWEFDSLASLDPWIDRLLDLLQAGPAFPRPAADLRIHAALLFALSFRRPDPVALSACIDHVQALLAPPIPASARVDAAAQLLAHYCNTADVAAAERVIALAEGWLEEPDLAPVYPALWWMQIGHCRAALADDAAATAAYARALHEVERRALTAPLLRVHCQFGLARLALCRNDIDAAERARAEAQACWTSARRIDSCMDAGLRGLIAAQRGDRIEALARAHEQYAQAGVVGIVPLRLQSAVQLVLAMCDAGEFEDARGLLAQGRQLIVGTAYAGLAYQLDLAEAWLHLSSGERDAAHAPLARGMAGSRRDPGMLALRLSAHVLPALLGEAIAAGIDVEHATRVIRSLRLDAPQDDLPGWPWPLEIRTLGRFEIRRDGEPVMYSRKTPRKTLALLKAIAALGVGGTVAEQRLMDMLWPDDEADAAANALSATVLRLRTLLGDAAAVVQQGGKLSLDRSRVWLDVFAFEAAVLGAETARQRRDPQEAQALARAVALYQGAFLAEDEEGWPVATRERLRGRFIHAVARLAERQEADGDPVAAIATCLRGLDADPAVESFYQGLMRCYRDVGRRSEGIAAYQRMRQILSVTLGLAPSAASERLYQALRAG